MKAKLSDSEVKNVVDFASFTIYCPGNKAEIWTCVFQTFHEWVHMTFTDPIR